jgi:hypothetical protein
VSCLYGENSYRAGSDIHPTISTPCFGSRLARIPLKATAVTVIGDKNLMHQDREVTREELHQLVWSKPTRTAAKEFGLSDVGLAKICRKLGVKKPPRGYWAKVAAGGCVKKPPLGVLPDGCASKAVIRAKKETEQVVERLPRDQTPKINVRDTFEGCSRLITVSRIELGKAKPDKYGMLDIRLRPGCLSVAVSEALVGRTLLVLDTLVQEFKERAIEVIPAEDEKLSRFVVGSEHVPFYIREQSKRTKEKGSYFDRYSPKGILSFVIDRYPSRAWHDGKAQRLEDLLGEIVAGTLHQGEVLRLQRLEREEWHRRWEEEQHLRELQEGARKKEQAKRRDFRAQVEKWNLCKMMREYIVERERTLENTTLEPEIKRQVLDWVAWAKQYVERIDPLHKQFKIPEPRESQTTWIDEEPDEIL